MRAELENMPRMKRCALAPVQGIYGLCSGRIRNPEWHHVFQYAGKQISETWAIVAGCTYHHGMVTKDRAIKMAFEAASLMEATEEDLAKYPRKDWAQIKKTLGIKKLCTSTKQLSSET